MIIKTWYYNFVRIHETLRVTPAMAAGVADRRWEIADFVRLWEAVEPKAGKRGPYRKKFQTDPLPENRGICIDE